jgi:hypothetical protein
MTTGAQGSQRQKQGSVKHQKGNKISKRNIANNSGNVFNYTNGSE